MAGKRKQVRTFRGYVDDGFTNGKQVADNWKRQYFSERKWSKLWGDQDSGVIYQLILAAGDDREAIEKAVGGESWTQIWCIAHHDYAVQGVTFGESETATICFDCLRKALKLKPAAARASEKGE